MDFKGVVIEESFKDKTILKEFKILKTEREVVTKSHRTPWLTQWTIHTIEIPEDKIDEVSEKISKALDETHEWYVEVKNNKFCLTIFHDSVTKKRVFKSIKTR